MQFANGFFALFSFFENAPNDDTGAVFNTTDWTSLSSLSGGWFVLLAALLVTGLFLGHRATQGAAPFLRGGLLALRISLALLLFALVAEPGVLQKATSRLANRVVLLTDTSASMNREASNGVSRAQVGARAAKAIAAELGKKEEPFVAEFLGFDDVVHGQSVEELNSMAAGSYHPSGKRTHIEKALLSLEKSPEGQMPLGGVVLITDGADTDGHEEEFSEKTLSHLRSLGVPIHSVWIRSTNGFFDRAIHDVIADEFAFVRNKVTLEVVLRYRGVPKDAQLEALPITLREDGNPILLETVVLDGKAGEKRVQITFEPKQAGKHVYSVEMPVHPQEAVALNNQFRFPLEVIRDRIRVLQVVGRPSWDERFVRRLLKENPSVDLISFFILRTTTSTPSAPNHELSLIPFPTRELFTEELNTFDVVIFQNFDYAPYSMGRYLQNVSDFVTESGGGFMMLGGNLSFSEAGYDNTVVEGILPLRLRGGRGHIDEGSFHPSQTLAGKTHPITEIGATLARHSEDPFHLLPKLEGINLVAGLQPGAEVLLEHPRLRLANGMPHPVLAVREVGKGRSMALLTDSSWLWSLPHVGKGGRGDAHRKLFANALRWLIRDPELSRVKVKSAKAVYEPDDEVVFEVRTFSQAYAPKGNLQVQLRVKPLDGIEAKEVIINGVTDEFGRLKIQKASLGTGAFRVEVTCTEKSRQVGFDEDAFIIRTGSLEQIFAEPRGAALKILASETGGIRVSPNKISDLNFVDHKVERVHRQQSEPLWNRFTTVLLLVLLAGVEWYLRRRRGFA
ncbi:MAG: hypothetical protein GY822_07260 [Deltaproteobacteria bacterium]|nr:hypothetical protein [Deltaproteobacteria bacterium]